MLADLFDWVFSHGLESPLLICALGAAIMAGSLVLGMAAHFLLVRSDRRRRKRLLALHASARNESDMIAEAMFSRGARTRYTSRARGHELP